MADLPDYYTQAQISEAEAASFKGGLDANKSPTPVSRDIYLATDTLQLFYCVADGTWVDVTHACLLLAGGTMTGNIAMGGKKVTGLGAPAAQDDALRYNRAEIRNNEIAVAAAIAYTKLALTGKIKAADIEAAAGIPLTKLENAVCSETEAGTIAAALIAAATKIVHKPDDQIVNNSTTLVNDEDLVIAVGANDVWLVEMALFVISASINPGIDYAFAVPGGGAMETVIITTRTSIENVTDATVEIPLPGTTVEKASHTFFLYVGGGTAGNLQLQWAQRIATVEDTKILANSFMLCHRLA